MNIEIRGRNFCGTAAHPRIACRGIAVEEGKMLLSHELISGWYLIPGGGLEEGETPEECCIRELQEETGLEQARGLIPEWVDFEDAVTIFRACEAGAL